MDVATKSTEYTSCPFCKQVVPLPLTRWSGIILLALPPDDPQNYEQEYGCKKCGYSWTPKRPRSKRR